MHNSRNRKRRRTPPTLPIRRLNPLRPFNHPTTPQRKIPFLGSRGARLAGIRQGAWSGGRFRSNEEHANELT